MSKGPNACAQYCSASVPPRARVLSPWVRVRIQSERWTAFSSQQFEKLASAGNLQIHRYVLLCDGNLGCLRASLCLQRRVRLRRCVQMRSYNNTLIFSHALVHQVRPSNLSLPVWSLQQLHPPLDTRSTQTNNAHMAIYFFVPGA